MTNGRAGAFAVAFYIRAVQKPTVWGLALGSSEELGGAGRRAYERRGLEKTGATRSNGTYATHRTNGTGP